VSYVCFFVFFVLCFFFFLFCRIANFVYVFECMLADLIVYRFDISISFLFFENSRRIFALGLHAGADLKYCLTICVLCCEHGAHL
jgi:hypothetical protein